MIDSKWFELYILPIRLNTCFYGIFLKTLFSEVKNFKTFLCATLYTVN